MKQKYPEELESVLMLKSLKDVNLPKFLSHDVSMFEGILMDLFLETVLPTPDYDVMLVHVNKNCKKMNLEPHLVFFEKVRPFSFRPWLTPLAVVLWS